MTVSTTSGRASYTGNGVTTAFAASFEFNAAADLDVYKADVLQTLTTDYTVSGGSGSTGTVTFLVAPANGETVVLVDNPDVTQLTDYTPNDPFPAESHEAALDKLTRIVRRLTTLLGRSMVLADSDVTTATTTLPSPAANNLLGWNAGATAIENKVAADISLATVTPFIATLLDDAAAADARITLGALSTASGAVAAANLATDAVETAKIKDLNVTTGKLADLAVTEAKLAAAAVARFVPAGAVMPFAMNSAPTGWLSCDGSAVSRTTYSTLFAAIADLYGVGDGSSTFNLPDLRGYFVRGSGTNGDGVASGTFGAKQADAFESHTHTQYTNSGAGSGPIVGGGAFGALNATTAATGDAETRPSNIAMLYCIKT